MKGVGAKVERNVMADRVAFRVQALMARGTSEAVRQVAAECRVSTRTVCRALREAEERRQVYGTPSASTPPHGEEASIQREMATARGLQEE